MAVPAECLVVIDVGHGNSTFIRCGRRTVLVDAGPKSHVLEFLDREGVTELSDIFVSHADDDHIRGLLAILSASNITVGAVRLNSDGQKLSAVWDDLIYELDQRSQSGVVDFLPALTAAQSGTFDDDCLAIQILGPSTYLAARGPGSRNRSGQRIGTNTISAVLKVTVRGRVLILLPGDVDAVGLQDLIEHGVDMRAPIMVFPHHGGAAGGANLATFTSTMIEQVRPQSVVFSIGRGLHGTPRSSVIGGVRAGVDDIHIACTQLSENCAAMLPAVTGGQIFPIFASGAASGACCAGSLVIDLAAEDGAWLNRTAHAAFVLEQVPGSLCRS